MLFYNFFSFKLILHFNDYIALQLNRPKLIKPVWKLAFTASIVLLSAGITIAQERQDPPAVLQKQTDAKQVLSKWFSKKKTGTDTTAKKPSTISTLPSAGFNPSVGMSVGVTSTAGLIFGDPKITTMSVLNTNAYISTKGLLQFEFKNNIFTNDDLYNIQGNVQVGKTVALDYGVGTGSRTRGEQGFSFDGLPLSSNSKVMPVNYSYIKVSERVYRRIAKNLLFGAGVIFNIYNDIDNEGKLGVNTWAHNYRYSVNHGFTTGGYTNNGLLLNLEYNSRDHINRPYEGMFADVILRTNETWMGSNKPATQLRTELRKYWGLSKINREHVLAFWFWGSFLLSGDLPYLELPGTGSDQTNRLGRGYTIGRFKGQNFAYSEAEYRFPISKNKLFSGVLFANAQTSSAQRNLNDVNLGEFVEPGGGFGLRILFNKYTRSNLCIDYGVGTYGARGIFIGLNEVF